MRGCRTIIWVSVVLAWMHVPGIYADELVLTTGERFTSSKVWEENDKIRFNMHGLVVSVNKSDVAAIIRNDRTMQPLADPVGNERSQPHLPTPALDTEPLPPARSNDPAEPTSPPPGSTKAPHHHVSDHKTKATGIGLKGITWNMRPTELSGLTKIKTEPVYGGIDQYWQPEGPTTFGSALLDGLVFGFWQDRLYSIMMWVDGKPGYGRLRDTVFERYGAGRNSKNSAERYFWAGDKTTDRLLEFDPERNIGIFWMRSRDLEAHIKQIYPDADSQKAPK